MKNPEYNFSDWTGNTNWQDEIFQTGFITNNNISITGASDKNSFYLGAGYAYEQGNIKHEKYSKITLNISNDYKVTDNLKVGFQFNGARMLPPTRRVWLRPCAQLRWRMYSTPSTASTPHCPDSRRHR